jgi:hypothetical protein
LVRLDLGNAYLGTEGLKALTHSPVLGRVRLLRLLVMRLNQENLRAFLASTFLQHLTWFDLLEGDRLNDSFLDLTPKLATEITTHPHLATLRLGIRHCDPQSRQVLERSNNLAWVSIQTDDRIDMKSYRALFAPDRSPPLDPPLDAGLFEWPP